MSDESLARDYAAYVHGKLSRVPATGIASGFKLSAGLFPHQEALTSWAVRRGRAAIFADTGLGKSRMQLAWADAVHRHTKRPVLILAPLAVAAQTVEEGAALGVEVRHAREADQVGPGITITNYDRLHKFDCSGFGAVVLDESSCIKHHDTRTLKTLLEAFRDTAFKLCATATPAPNDWTELGTHAEFLGVCTRQEMLSEFFTHDGGDTSVWRLKGHARHLFWQWVSQWGAMVRRPSDLGFDDGAYALPPLHLHEHTVKTQMPLNGMLFAVEAQSLSERRDARRMSLADRVADCIALVNANRYKMPHGQRSAQGIHEGLLQGEPGQVQETDAGKAGRVQPEASGAVRAERGVEGGGALGREGVAAVEPDEAQGAEAQEVRDRSFGLHGPDDDSERPLCDLRLLGHGQAEFLPGGGPLPQDGKGSRAAVHGVQSGAGQVQGRDGSAVRSDCLSDEAWLIWCEYNDEQDALERAFGDRAFSVRGPMTSEDKEAAIRGWVAGERPIMISKPSIMGWGINAQHCRNIAFVGVTDSFESYYQAVRRCWRFGQKRDVHVHIFASSAEGAVVANLRRKERDAQAMAESLSAETRDAVMQAVTGTTRQTNDYHARRQVAVPALLKEAA
jgi:hypothetical protein